MDTKSSRSKETFRVNFVGIVIILSYFVMTHFMMVCFNLNSY